MWVLVRSVVRVVILFYLYIMLKRIYCSSVGVFFREMDEETSLIENVTDKVIIFFLCLIFYVKKLSE